jgi:hypothetical protein
MNQHHQQCNKPIVAPATQKSNAKEQHKQYKKKKMQRSNASKQTHEIFFKNYD